MGLESMVPKTVAVVQCVRDAEGIRKTIME
jgi:hypothetical protein